MTTRIDWKNSGFTSDTLTASSRTLFGDLDGFQFDLNLAAMSNFAPLYSKVADIFPPSRIAEIGVFEGALSTYLVTTLGSRTLGFDFVDTELDPRTIARIQEANNGQNSDISFFNEDSHTYLDRCRPVDWYMIDGDHNYKTVSGELSRIASSPRSKHILFCQDTGWPCARRDSYYNPDDVSGNNDIAEGGLLSPFEESLAKEFGLTWYSVSRQEGKEQNGVLTAIEDFLKIHVDYQRITFTPFFGLTLLWRESEFSPLECDHLRNLKRDSDLSNSWLGKLELNRLMLVIMLQRAGRIWTKQRAYIDELQEKLSDLEDQI